MVYTVANPDEYLAITGLNVEKIKICKKAFVLPFQRCKRFSIQPKDYSLNLQAMTKEKLQFLLPVVFTVGPDVNQRGAKAIHGPVSKVAQAARRDGTHSDHELDEAANPLINPEDHGDALMKYAMLLADADSNKKNHDGRTQHIEQIVKGIIEGETRVLVSSMTMEEIFTARDEFKKKIYKNIQSELRQFGLKIYNANVKELRDAPNSNYFESLSRKAHEGAINQARIDVAEAQRKGNVGEAQRVGEQNRDIAKINAETAVQKTERDSERAKAEAQLATRKVVFNKDVEIARIEAERATEARNAELQKDVEIKRAMTELERLRASDVVKATIARESKQQAADASQYTEKAGANAALFREQKAADAAAYKVQVQADAALLAATKDAEAKFIRQQKEADAEAYKVQVKADAALLAATKDAEAKLIRQQKEAEGELVQQQKKAAGLSAMAGAYAELGQALGGPAGLIQYMMMEKGVYTDLAKANAEAIRGLNPKMTIWNTGDQAGSEGGRTEGGGMGGMNSIRNMYQMLPPLMSTISEQTGIGRDYGGQPSADISYMANLGGLGAVVTPRRNQSKETNGVRD